VIRPGSDPGFVQVHPRFADENTDSTMQRPVRRVNNQNECGT